MNEGSVDSNGREEEQKQSVWRNPGVVAALITAIATVIAGIGTVIIQSAGSDGTKRAISPSTTPAAPSPSATSPIPVATPLAPTRLPATTAVEGVPTYLVDLPHSLGQDTDVGLVLINGVRFARSFRAYVYLHQQTVVRIPSGYSRLRGTVGYADESPNRDNALQVQIEVTSEIFRQSDLRGTDLRWRRLELIDLPARGGADVEVVLPSDATGIRLSAVQAPALTQVAWGDLHIV